MPAPRVTLRIQLERELMERLQDISHHLDVLPSDFIQQAIANELSRQDLLRQTESAALDELHRTVLAQGQAVSIQVDEETGEQTTCQLCLRVIPRGRGVDGPLLCESCYALAKGEAAQGGKPSP